MSKISAQYANNGWSTTKPVVMNCHDHADESHKHSLEQEYRPFYISSNPHNDAFLGSLTKIPSAKSMVDIEGNNLLVAQDEGSRIFSKQGLNYLVSSLGADIFYFSMCSTRTQDGQTSVIDNFGSEDRIYLFCTKREIELSEVSIQYDPARDNTILTINDPMAGEIAVSVLGHHENLLGSVVLNIKWGDLIPD